MDGPAARLHRLRILSGKTPESLAAKSGLGLPAYYDLEADDDEFYMAVSLRVLARLSAELGITPDVLFGDAELREDRIRPAELVRRMGKVVARRKVSLPEFENEIGFAVGDSLQDPSKVWEWNVDCLRAVCGAIGVDWRRALPLKEWYGQT